MNKMDLVNAVADKTGLSAKNSRMAVNAVIECISEAMAGNEKIMLAGFGVFEVKQRAARMGRNPRTNKPVGIPATQLPVFKPSVSLKAIVDGAK